MRPTPPFASKLAAAALLLACASAHAQPKQDGLYGEIGLTQITYKESGYSLSPSVIRAMVGVDINPNLAVEGMLGVGMSNDTVRISGVNVTGEIDHTWGFFLKPKATLAPGLDVFARLGYAKTKISASVPGYAIASSGGDLSYGVGASYKFNDRISASLDYMSYYNRDEIKGTGVTFALGFRF